MIGALRVSFLRRPWWVLAWLVALATGLYVIAGPMLVARYPMMTDLPFHAASASVFAHYGDEAYRFREQFVLQPFAVPYLTHYLLSAGLMRFTDAVTAIKIATAILLSLLPLGLGVLFHGMRKSPLLGCSGLLLVWCQLTSWGFINFVAALGLFAMALGAALCSLDRGTRAWRLVLSGSLLALFVTHPFRFPFAVLAIAAAALLLYPATRRWRPLLLPMLPSLLLFGLWWLTKPASFDADWGSMTPDLSRLDQLRGYVYGSLTVASEASAFARAITLLLLLAVGLKLIAWGGRGRAQPTRSARRFSLGAHALVACSALGLLLGYLVLPMEVNSWWYIYPREATAFAFIALAWLPDIPRRDGAALAVVVVIACAVVPLGTVTITSYRQFDRATEDFRAISAELPAAPKLAYLIFDHSGSTARNTPFIHLPAYIQAERGGWLSFHFASMQGSPLRYRSDSPSVPPPTPRRWEWTPGRFRMQQHGRFFEWFLIRDRQDPIRHLQGGDPVEQVARRGSWWLYRRKRPTP